MSPNRSYRVRRNYFLAWILILITFQFCSKDFVSLGRHFWRCRERNHHDNGSNDARSSYQRSIVSVEQTDLQSLSLVSITRQTPRPRHKNKAIIMLSSHPSLQSLSFDSKLVVVVVVIGLMETRPYEHPPTVKYNVLVAKR